MRHSEKALDFSWIFVGILCGLGISIAYPLMVFGSLPFGVLVFLASVAGPLLGLASVGLYFFLSAQRTNIAAQIAVAANIIAGVLFTTMLLVQLAIRSSRQVPPALHNVHLGLDAAWDVYIGLGTFLFAWSMLKHERLGWAFAFPGLVISLLVLGLNVWTFPTPPAEAGLFDVGPLVGLWYLAVTIRMIFSLDWAREALRRPT